MTGKWERWIVDVRQEIPSSTS